MAITHELHKEGQNQMKPRSNLMNNKALNMKVEMMKHLATSPTSIFSKLGDEKKKHMAKAPSKRHAKAHSLPEQLKEAQKQSAKAAWEYTKVLYGSNLPKQFNEALKKLAVVSKRVA
ncbi:hypothetical protein L1987_14993 [Smallanthus sonchifolius]|uniref:Uncharacterized protein n=1 Tax=Smallanthus sonchifolius TaxID=185202 RepID=A0ACB9J6X5_9ASTR|nr:hypothetical protein L1987_14993 [Smallanthus sonchifolius]